MNFKQIETFYWVAKLGSFTAAAERLNSTQSTVSLRIQELERDLGVKLFDRSLRSARITPSGRGLMAYAEQFLDLAAQVRQNIAKPEMMAGAVRLGVAEVISITWLPRLVAEMHKRHPRVVLELDEALTEELVAKLKDGTLDMIFAAGRIPGYNFVSTSLGKVRFVWVASPRLGIATDRTLGPRDLQEWPIIALSRESYHHTSIQDWFRYKGANFRRIYTCKSMGVAASLAAAGLGVTLLPERCFRREIDSGVLKVLDTQPAMPAVEFTAMAAMDSIQPLAPTIAAIAQQVSDFAGGAAEPRPPLG